MVTTRAKGGVGDVLDEVSVVGWCLRALVAPSLAVAQHPDLAIIQKAYIIYYIGGNYFLQTAVVDVIASQLLYYVVSTAVSSSRWYIFYLTSLVYRRGASLWIQQRLVEFAFCLFDDR